MKKNQSKVLDNLWIVLSGIGKHFTSSEGLVFIVDSLYLQVLVPTGVHNRGCVDCAAVVQRLCE